jgi:chromosome segregation ATPase
MASLFELQQLKTGAAAGYAKQLDELEYHAKRTTEIYMSMLQMEQAERLQLNEDHADKIAQLASELSGLQEENGSLMAELKKEALAGVEYRKQIGEFEKHIQQLQQANERGEELLSEYKARIDSLSKMVTDQQEAVNQAKGLEQRLSDLTRLTTEQMKEIARMETEYERELHQRDEFSHEAAVRLEREIEALNTKHADELITAQARAEIAQERAVLDARRELSKQAEDDRSELLKLLQTSEREHGTEVRLLYAEMDKLRQQLAEAQKPKQAKRQPGKTDPDDPQLSPHR